MCCAAPTGSGKTLAAFLAAIDDLVRQGLSGALRRRDPGRLCLPAEGAVERHQRNLEAPLAGIRDSLAGARAARTSISAPGCAPAIRPPGERQRMRRRPPHIVVTTPESLYILLGSESGRRMLATTRTVIVDEIHALAAEQARQPSGAFP